MITITFPNRETEQRAVGFLLGRFSGRVMKSGEHVIPAAALEALANQGIPFTVQGKVAWEPPNVTPPSGTLAESGFGCMRGQIQMSEDFDEPLEEFLPYMQ